jgi:large subunit ribosomal protein L18
MSGTKIKRVPFRRRRNGRTDYRARKRTISSGLSRAVVRRSLNGLYVQIIEYDAVGDKVLCSSSSHDLKGFGWRFKPDTLPAAYLVGYIAGKRATKGGITECVLDIGHYASTKGARVYGVLKGMIDAGLDVPHSDEILPKEPRLYGEHINKDIKEEVKRIKGEIDQKGTEVKTDA